MFYNEMFIKETLVDVKVPEEYVSEIGSNLETLL